MEANIFNYFTVDWLAKSHHDTIKKEGPVDTGPVDTMLTHFKPHVPCMVQPRPPTSYNKVYLQPKPKITRFEFTNSTEKPTNLESRLSSPLHPSSCPSPNRKLNVGYYTLTILLILHVKTWCCNTFKSCFFLLKSILLTDFFSTVSENSEYSSGYDKPLWNSGKTRIQNWLQNVIYAHYTLCYRTI